MANKRAVNVTCRDVTFDQPIDSPDLLDRDYS